MKPLTPTIKRCPSCGSEAIHPVRRAWKGSVAGRECVVPSLAFYVCPDCAEEVFTPEAMRKIESHSSAFAGRRLTHQRT